MAHGDVGAIVSYRVRRWLGAGTDEAARLTAEIVESLDGTATIAATGARQYRIELDEAGIVKLHALVRRRTLI